MRRFETFVILIAAITALGASGLWLRTELSHHRETVLVDRMLNGKSLGIGALKRVLMNFPFPSHDILPGKHLFYGSTLAVAAADLPDLPEPLRLQWLDQAGKALPAALAREPAHTHSWVHLAYAAWLFNGPNRKSIDALRMSIYTSPADRQILIWRLKLAGLNKEFWDAGFRELVSGQTALAWRHAPKSLAEMAASHHIDDLVRQTLANDPAELARFESLAAKSVFP